MKSLVPPNGDHIVEFDEFAKNRLALKALANEIRMRYTDYETKKNRLETLQAIARSQDQTVAFEGAYISLRARLNKELSENAAEVEPCPYCLIDYARDWDHFLPRQRFPDFAVYRPNLMRVCTRCNRAKGSRLVARPRKTLNPYFDPIDAVPFLKSEVNTDPTLTAVFRVEPPAGTDPYFANLALGHFKAYDLARKYRAQAADKLSELVRAIQYEVSHGAALTQDLIEKEVGRLACLQNPVPNHWQVALARGLSEAPNFHRYIRDRVGDVGAAAAP